MLQILMNVKKSINHKKIVIIIISIMSVITNLVVILKIKLFVKVEMYVNLLTLLKNVKKKNVVN